MATFDDENMNAGMDQEDPSQPNMNQNQQDLWLAKKKMLRQVIQNANNPQTTANPSDAAPAPSAGVQAQQQKDPVTGIRDDAGAGQSYVPTPEAALDRKVMNNFINQYTASLHSFDADALEEKRQELEDQLAPSSPKMQAALKPYDDALSTNIAQMKEIQDQKKGAVQTTQYAQAAEALGNALAQYAAGLYGAKHGVDMSGVRYSQVDWQKNLGNQLGLLDDQIKQLQQGRGETLRQRDEQQNRLVQGGTQALNIATTGEKEAQSQSQDVAKLRLNAAVEVYRSQTAQYAQAANKAQQLAASGQRTGLHQIDADSKDLGNRVKGIDQAIGTLKGLDSGDIKDDTKAQELLNKALAQAGISPQDLADNEKGKAFFGLFNTTGDKQAGIKYLNALRSQAQDAYSKLSDSRTQLLQNTAGAAPAANDKFQFGQQGQAPQQAPAAAQPTPSTAPAATAGTVRVRNKQTGQTGSIPAANLQAALSSGQFEQIQ